MKTIIILGGGVGGVITANILRKKIGSEHKIIVVDKKPKYTYEASLLWIANGTRNEKAITRELDSLKNKGIEFVHVNIEQFDPKNKQVIVDGKTLKGDYIVVALGAEITDSLDIKDKGYNLYTAEGAEGLYKSLSQFNGGKVVVLISSMPFKCPAAPYEAALLINSLLKKKGTKTSIELYSPEAGPMGVAGKKLSDMVRGIVEAKGIKYYPAHQATEVSGNTVSFNNDVTTNFDLLAYVPRHQCPKVIRDTDLVDESGWVKITDSKTLTTKFPDVYAIGDITNIPLVQGKSLPKAGVFAHDQAIAVANNIAVEITGKGSSKQFTGNGMCFIELGEGKAGFAKGNFYTEPMPTIRMFMPGFHWHLGKVLFEKWFLSKWF